MSVETPLKDPIILNASPLITLFKSNLAVVLPALFSDISVPKAVFDEISVQNDVAAKGLRQADWLDTKTVAISKRVLIWNLGKGESEVLSWALSHPQFVAVVDDLAARNCAEALGIKYIGTAGILLLAKRNSLIDSLEIAFEDIRRAGLYLSDELISSLIQSEHQPR